MIEKTISSEIIYKGAILNLRKDKVSVKDGKTAYREIIEHNGAVAVVAVTNDNKIVMVKQFRKACEDYLLEIPAGKIDGNEEPKNACLRELKEETGYQAGNIRFLTKFYAACGYSQEQISIFLCDNLVAGETDFDDDEEIEIIEKPLDELVKMCFDGTINDSKTIIGILMAKEYLDVR